MNLWPHQWWRIINYTYHTVWHLKDVWSEECKIPNLVPLFPKWTRTEYICWGLEGDRALSRLPAGGPGLMQYRLSSNPPLPPGGGGGVGVSPSASSMANLLCFFFFSPLTCITGITTPPYKYCSPWLTLFLAGSWLFISGGPFEDGIGFHNPC